MSATTSMCDGLGQAHEFAIALKKAGFDDAVIQKVINSRGNKLAKAMFAAVNNGVEVDDRFQLVNTFDMTVLDDYDHATRLAVFEKAHRSEFASWNDALTDANFSKVTTKLTPGRKFRVKVFQITRTVSSEDCLAKIRSEKGVLVGAQGASLAYELGKDKLPVGRWSVSFDEKDALPFVGGYHRVPSVGRHSDGGFWFNLGRFECDWDDADCLLCFCDLSEE